MAFSLDCELRGYEYRGVQEGVSSKTGKPWMSLVFEGENARQLDVSVPEELQGNVRGMGLSKGLVMDLRVRAVAGATYSFVRLLELPELHDDAVGF